MRWNISILFLSVLPVNKRSTKVSMGVLECSVSGRERKFDMEMVQKREVRADVLISVLTQIY